MIGGSVGWSWRRDSEADEGEKHTLCSVAVFVWMKKSDRRHKPMKKTPTQGSDLVLETRHG
jgi:hypothetical protein